MNDPGATLETDDNDGGSDAAASTQPQPVRGAPMKFTYASGSRPLEGYTIKRGVGIGGFGEVYFATSDAGKEVALKRIQRNLDVELRGVGQCLNLKHVNLIDLYDIKHDDLGQGWVVMEYVNGESLKDVLDRNPNGMPLEEVSHWFDSVAAGVTYLHDHGIVHRDLKPGNIFADDDAVKIGDYGLSKFISCSRRSGQTESVGTFHYMAPEIGKGVYGKEIDIYALGIILYEMLTGQTPFDGESSQEIIMKHLTADPDLSEIKEPYRSVIRTALAKDPDRRYSNVPEMLAALRADQTTSASSMANQSEPIQLTHPRDAQPFYINDDRADGISFGQLQEVVTAQLAPDPQVPQTSEEPIAKAVSHGFSNVSNWWNNAKLSAPIKVIVLLGVAMTVVFMTFSAPWMIPMAMIAGMIYLVYFGVRTFILSVAEASEHKPANVMADPLRLVSRQQIIRAALTHKSSGERLGELTGSMIMSAFVAAVICLVMMVVGGQPLDASVDTWAFYSWITLTSVAAAWMVLGTGKVWEGGSCDIVRRRFVMLVSGLAIGAVVYATSNFMLIDFADSTLASTPLFSYPESMFTADGAPELSAFMVFFAGLLVILKWWKQSDPLRTTRLSVWTTACCVFWAWILPFPQPLGFLLAATISIAVQLSTPWISPTEQARIVANYREA